MKRAITSILLASALLAGTAQADTFFGAGDVDYCQALAGIATDLSELRDNGFKFSNAQAAVADARGVLLAESPDGYDDWIDGYIADNYKVVELVYAYPRLTPSQEGNFVYNLCRQGLLR